jgi:hypothetical protein
MPSSKEDIARKYNMSADDFDVVTALALRPTCENCNKPLPPPSLEARICSFECTFCASCVDGILRNVCPTCGGGFTPRPIRPVTNWRRGNYLGAYPACTAITHKPVDAAAHAVFSRDLEKIPPQAR